MDASAQTEFLDAVCIGALNTDFIATRSYVQSVDSAVSEETIQKFEAGVEKIATEQEIDEILDELESKKPLHAFLGGSAFNVVHTLAQLNAGFRLAYIGVSGRAERRNLDFAETLNNLGVDTGLLALRDERSGVCVSLIENGERSLRTYPGANSYIVEHLVKNQAAILDLLSRSKLTHITSLFDDTALSVLAPLLKEAKSKNPWLKVSFDPGHYWAQRKSPEMDHILECADYIFLNYKEFQSLGDYHMGRNDRGIAKVIFDRSHGRSAVVVLKQYNYIDLFAKVKEQILRRRYPNRVLTPESIEDATGAGDVFAAGCLAGILLSPGLDWPQGVELGLEMVRAKLATAGSAAFATFAGILDNLLSRFASDREENVSMVGKPKTVFIGHGGNRLWLELKDYLSGEGIAIVSFESKSRSGQQVIEVLQELLGEADFAAIVLTAEDSAGDKMRARQNAVHEAGLFQGKLGFAKVALLVQDDVEQFSNIDGLQVHRFSGSNIRSTFLDLMAQMRRENIV